MAIPQVRPATPSRAAGPVISLWTNDPGLARAGLAAGIDRLGIDLERTGKAVRQARDGRNWFSPHHLSDLRWQSELAPPWLFARTDPLGPGWPDQARAVIERGARVVLLPDVRSAREVATAVAELSGRAALVPMLESRAGLDALPDIVSAGLCDEVFLGANDLAHDLGLPSRMHALVDPRVVSALAQIRASGLHFGIAGTTRPTMSRESGLPVAPGTLLAYQGAVGADRLLLARSFAAAATHGPGRCDPTWVNAAIAEIRDGWLLARNLPIADAVSALRSQLAAGVP